MQILVSIDYAIAIYTTKLCRLTTRMKIDLMIAFATLTEVFFRFLNGDTKNQYNFVVEQPLVILLLNHWHVSESVMFICS